MPTLVAFLVALALAIAVAAPTAMPAGKRTGIVFASGRSLLAVAPGGGTARRIARIPAGTVDISASADGRRFALITNRPLKYPRRGAVRTLYLLRLGHRARRVKSFQTQGPFKIGLSPGGDQIAFDRGTEIWTLDVSGGGERQVTNGPGVAYEPAYTADGTGLLFVRAVANRPQLFRMALNGGPEEPLGAGEGRMPTQGSDARIAYVAGEEGAAPERILVMDVGGANARTLATSRRRFLALHPVFSPDAKRVAYMRIWERTGRIDSYRYSIHTVGSAGGGTRKVIGGLRAGADRRGPIGPLWVPLP